MGHDMAILPLSGGPPVLMATIVINQNAAHGPVVKPNMVVSPDGFNADISVRNCEQSSHKKTINQRVNSIFPTWPSMTQLHWVEDLTIERKLHLDFRLLDLPM